MQLDCVPITERLPGAPLALVRRPRAFADVIGHKLAIAQLHHIASSSDISHVMLTGPSGVGKTTLARLLVKRLHCQSPQGAEPCGTCASCRTLDEGGRHRAYNMLNAAGRDGSKDELAAFLEDLGSPPPGYRNQIVFIDEAQQLSAYAQDLLLTTLEDFGAKLVFILGLIDEDRLSEPLKARCRLIRLEAPTVAEKLLGLQRICEAGHIHTESDALMLLAERMPNHRRALGALQQLRDASGPGGHITADLTRQVVLREESSATLEFLKSALEGDMPGTMEAVTQMGDDAAACFSFVQRLLLILKKKFVGPSLMPLRRDETLIYDEATLAAVMAPITRNAEALGLPVADYFRVLADHFIFQPSATPDAFKLHAAVFVDLCRAPLSGTQSPAPVASLPLADEPYRSTRASRSRQMRALQVPHAISKNYLSVAQARTVYEASTFLTQIHGLCFNAALRVGFADWRIHHEDGAANLMTSVARELAQRLKDWTGASDSAGGLHRLSLLGRDPAGHLTGVLLLHLPMHVTPLAEDWLNNWFARFGHKKGVLTAPPLFDVAAPADPRNAVQRHWRLVQRHVWAGVDPDITMSGVSLTEQLGVAERYRRPAGRVSRPRLHLSQSISRANWAAVRDQGMAHVSAWEAGRWDQLLSGWELREYREREALRRQRDDILRAFNDRRDRTGDPLSRLTIDRLENQQRESWLVPPLDRPRTKPLWPDDEMHSTRRSRREHK